LLIAYYCNINNTLLMFKEALFKGMYLGKQTLRVQD
jgi:hypothetical protein